MKVKMNRYIVVFNEGKTSFVTSIDPVTKRFFCNSGEEAQKFTQKSAEDVVTGMLYNGLLAGIVLLPANINPVNRDVEKGGWL